MTTSPLAPSLAGRRRALVAALVGLPFALALSPRPAAALTDEEVFRTLRFQVEPPGARSMGAGGAQIAVADDPSAVYTNPSGLGFLDRPQVMLDFKGTAFDDSAWSATGLVPGLTPPGAAGQILLEDDNVGSASFIGYAHPIGDWWVIGVSRHEWMNTERDSFASFDSTAFPTFEGSAPGISREALSSVGSLDALMDVYGVSVAVRPHERVSLGLTVSLARLDVVQTMDNYTYAVADANGNGMPDTLLRPIDYRTIVDDDDTQFTFAAGLLWKPMDTISLGVVYRDGPTFDVVEQVRPEGVRAADLREYLVGKGIANASGEFLSRWSFPESYGLGIAFGPYACGPRGDGGLVISADAEHVEYADLLDGFVGGLNQQLFGAASTGSTFAMDDETNFHFGIAYSWTVGYNNMIHVRGGAYTDQDHSLISAGIGAGVGEFAGRDDVVHGTLGMGFTLRRGFYSFEMDAAADVSELGEQYFGSALIKF